MPPTGSTFTDWQQVEQESRLLMNEDFSWSEPPQRRRRRIAEEPIRARRSAVLDPEPMRDHELSGYEPTGYESAGYEPTGYESAAYESLAAAAPHLEPAPGPGWDQSTESHSHFDELMEQWNAAYGEPAEAAFDLSDPGVQLATQGGRRTVVITGRGDERYVPAPRRSRSAELRFHERSTFSPDRAALWAVLLSIALVIGAIAH